MAIKEIGNTICGKSNCSRQTTTKILFSLGFSAGFCSKCADNIIQQGLGIKRIDLKNGSALDEARGPISNADSEIASFQEGDPKWLQMK
jgi:hypothetical protein